MTEAADGDPPGARDVARLLTEIGTLLELNGSDSFRTRAFASAARSLEGLDVDLVALALDGRLTTLRGVGSGIEPVIREYLLTGRSTLREELEAVTPLGLHDLMKVPGLGPKRIHRLYATLGVDSLDALENAAAEGRIAALPGFGPKTESRIREGIDFARASRRLRLYPDGVQIARTLLEWLRSREDVEEAEIAGALRRRMEVVDAVELVASSAAPRGVLRAFSTLQGAGPLDGYETGSAEIRLSDGMTARLRCVPAGEFAGVLAWETGSEAHLAALSTLARERGGDFDRGDLTLEGESISLTRESDLYASLGLQYVQPELREGLDEIRLAAAGTLPTLVEEDQLTGAFHCHTTYSDGRATLREMAEAARLRGWSYLGIADHSRTAAYAGGLTVERIVEQHAEIDELNSRLASKGDRFHVFKGIESDILPDGTLDYPDEVLATFDYVVGSVHSSFGMTGDAMTERLIRAARSPRLTILGHPTGRLLLRRAGYAFDFLAVLEAVAESGVVVEINADPRRLDLDWRRVREVVARGVLIAVNPDAHSVAGLANVTFGIDVARKAGLEAPQLLNTWPLDEVAEYLEKRKRKGEAGTGG